MSEPTPGPVTAQMLGRLLDSHGPALVLFARQWCDCPEDAVQDALLSLVKLRKPPESLLAWLYRAVRNRAVSLSRSDTRRRRREAQVTGAREEWFEAAQEDRMDAQEAAGALRCLPVEQREVIVARLWGGLTFEEAGQAVGCSSSAAHRRYEAGLAALRERLGVPCPERNGS
jgi:RNA polymerase sigma factor (sigma-70 family)